jgi:potassium efflux system protein
MKRRASFFAALFLAGAISAFSATTPTVPAATNAPAAVAPAPPPNPKAIAAPDIFSRAQMILDQYPDPATAPAHDPVETDVKQAMAEKEPELQIFSAETAQLLGRNPSLDRIQTFLNFGANFATYPKSWNDAITAGTTKLEKKHTDLAAAKDIWTQTQAALTTASAAVLPEYTQKINEVLARIDAVRRDTEARQTRLLKLQVQVAIDSKVVSDALDQLGNAQSRALSQLVVPNAPPIWSSAPSPPDESGMGWARQKQTLTAYVRAEPGKFLIHALLLAVLGGAFWWLRIYARRLCQDEPGIIAAAGIFERPLATALLLTLAASPLLYYPIAPRLLSAILGAIALVPTIILLRRLIEPRLFPILYALAIFFFLEEVRSVAQLPPEAARAYLLAEILGGVSFLGWLLLTLRRAGATQRFSRVVRLAARVAFAVLSAGWLAEVLGFTLLANLLCTGVQRSATLALALYASIRILEALLFIMMRLRPLSDLGMVRLHGPMMLRRAQRLLVWTAAAVWLLQLFEQLPLRTGVMSDVGGFFRYHDERNHLVFTIPGKILSAIVIGWSLYQISRFVRFALETDFFPRLHLGAGIPYAISTSLHYVMLAVAFIAATYVLGIDMTQFTILVSALGVGVGFGLQNIINNFVSGLILLFERPVTVGDSVQVGDAKGIVERIGIRASVLRSAGGSELIIPNGSLISNNVTNWTLSSREGIVLIPLNVVRGPDVGHLIELLVTTAAAHPDVLKQPPPRVLAQALGANMSFELRAWTRATADGGWVRSDLILAINTALARENIVLA